MWFNLVMEPTEQSWDVHHVLLATSWVPTARSCIVGQLSQKAQRASGRGGWEAGGGWRLVVSAESVTTSQRCATEFLLQGFCPSVLGNIPTSTKPSFPQQISFLETPLNKTQREKRVTLFS